MATHFEGPAAMPLALEQRERRFYLQLAIAIAATVVAGFGGYIVVGISSFNAPWWVHVHGISFMAWVMLYLVQNLLVVRGDFAHHRRLGAAMGLLALWLALVGTSLLYLSLQAHRAPPPVFSAGMLIAMDMGDLLGFIALVGAGLMLRQQPDWHRRLMLGATVTLIAPALGRLTVLTFGFSWSLIVLAQITFIVAAMVFDRANRGGVHPALVCSGAVLAVIGAAVPFVATLGPVTGLARAVAGG